ncbi:MAG: GGDEF domain-containing protein [Pseudomonadota bacterium]
MSYLAYLGLAGSQHGSDSAKFNKQAPRPGAAAYVLLPLLYFACAKLSAFLGAASAGIVVFWLPGAVLLAVVLHYRAQRLGLFAALALLAEMAADMSLAPWYQGALLGAAQIIGAVAAYRLMRRMGTSPALDSIEDMAGFVCAGPLLGALLGGLLGAAVARAVGGDGKGYWFAVRSWWFANALGLLMLTPLLLKVLRGRWKRPKLLPRDAIVALASLGLAGLLWSAQDGVLHAGALQDISVTPLLLLLPLLYLATRFGLGWTAAGIGLAALAAVGMLGYGQRPFGSLDMPVAVMRAQEFILTLSLAGLGVASLLAQLKRSRRELEHRLIERSQQLQVLNRQLLHQAQTDGLTGLFNRRAFFERAVPERERCLRYDRPLALLMVDVDHFNAVNERYGHAAGDEVLRHIARILSETARSSDIAARYGGEEFAVLAAETDHEAALVLAERLNQVLRVTPVRVDGQAIALTVSMGLALLQADESLAQLLRRADAALHLAKANGRDRVELALP